MTINTKRSADALANASGGIYTNSNNLPVDWSASVFSKITHPQFKSAADIVVLRGKERQEACPTPRSLPVEAIAALREHAKHLKPGMGHALDADSDSDCEDVMLTVRPLQKNEKGQQLLRARQQSVLPLPVHRLATGNSNVVHYSK
jgi:hypothetical protein